MAEPSVKKEPELYVQSGSLGLLQSLPWIVAMGSPTQQVFGGKFTPLRYFYRQNRATVYYEKKNLDELAVKAKKILSKDFNVVYNKWKHICAELAEISKQAHTSPRPAGEGFRLTWEKIVEFWQWSVFIDSFDTGLDFAEINRIAALHKLSRQDVQILTTPVQLSYLQEFELAVLKLCAGGKAESLVEEWHWIKTDYANFSEFTAADAREEISRRKKENWQRNLAALENFSNEVKSRQAEVLKRCKLKENPLWLYRNLVAWRDERKKFNYTGLYALCKYARGMLRERNRDEEEFAYIVAAEYMRGEIPTDKTLLERFKIGAMLNAQDDKVEVITGKEAAAKYAELEAKRRGEKFDLRGQPACLGRISAKVRIVLQPSEFPSFQQGEILVTDMTRPEFLPLMKKAAGIITDEGGVTCHAAIVSRELNIPCIVGTQTATKSLKTGQKVELDAFHGLVKLIEQS